MCVLHNIRGRANGWEKRGLEKDDFTQYTPTLQNYQLNVLDQLEIDRWQQDAPDNGEPVQISYDNVNNVREPTQHRIDMFQERIQHLAQHVLKLEMEEKLMWLKQRNELYPSEIE